MPLRTVRSILKSTRTLETFVGLVVGGAVELASFKVTYGHTCTLSNSSSTILLYLSVDRLTHYRTTSADSPTTEPNQRSIASVDSNTLTECRYQIMSYRLYSIVRSSFVLLRQGSARVVEWSGIELPPKQYQLARQRSHFDSARKKNIPGVCGPTAAVWRCRRVEHEY